MKKIFFIPVFVLGAFLIEFFLFNLIGDWCRPDLSLLLVICFTIFFGIRYGILTAVLAGLLKDSFGIGVFGITTFSFLMCAYLTIILRKYIYLLGSRLSFLVLVFGISLLNIVIQFLLRFMFTGLNPAAVFKFVFIPEVFLTLLVSVYTYTLLKKCALKFFV